MNDDIQLRVLKIIHDSPHITQRELANMLGVSLGKTNYCLRSLITKGLLKARNFKNNRNKIAYTYLLTPAGIEEKASMTVDFLRRKLVEYEALRQEIEQLKSEVQTREQVG